MSGLSLLQEAVVSGNAQEAERLTRELLSRGDEVRQILHDGLIPGMNTISEKWQQGEAFIPQVLLSAKAMHAGLSVLEPHLASSEVKPLATVVIGTVKGDVHDIGKTLVGMMLRGAGFEVKDLGVDVAPERFAEAVKDNKAAILGMSALLSTTMPSMRETIECLEASGLREGVKVIIGGAPTSRAFAESIGADGYGVDGVAAIKEAKALVGEG
ncbi:MAG: corrinoid protein [Nitrospinota bacterium]